MVQTDYGRSPVDLSHLVFSSGKLGRLMTLSTIPVISGDSFSEEMVGSLRLSPLRRGLTVDSCVDILSFYVPYRHIYGQEWVDMMKEGVSSSPMSQVSTVPASYQNLSYLGVSSAGIYGQRTSLPKWLHDGYRNIYNNYFKIPYLDNSAPLDSLSTFVLNDEENHQYGARCQYLKSLWSTPAPLQMGSSLDRDISLPVSGAVGTLNASELTSRLGEIQTDEERAMFAHRYRDVISNVFGGKTTIDADQRPQLLMRSTFWASGYDVDGTSQESLGQFSGRVLQSFSHKVPRFFCSRAWYYLDCCCCAFS